MITIQDVMEQRQNKAPLLEEMERLARSEKEADINRFDEVKAEVEEINRKEQRMMEAAGLTDADFKPIPQHIGEYKNEARTTLDDKGKEIPLLKHDQRMSDAIGGNMQGDIEPSASTTGKLIRGMLTGWEGLESERRALVGAEDPQGGYMLPSPLSTRFIDLARAKMALSQAGAITVPVEADSLKIPKLLSDPSPYWRGELDDITASDPTFGAVMLQPKTVAILTLVSHEVWEDAAGLGQAVEDAMSSALAVEIDRVGMFGGGAGNASEPVGIYYTDGVNSIEMDTNGAIPGDYDKFLDCIQKIEEANADPAYVIYSPRTKRKLAGIVTGITSDKTKLEPPQDFNDLRKLISTAVPDNLTWGSATDECSAALMGGFPNVYMGVRNQVRIDVSPHGSGVFNKMGLWVRAFARVDFAVVRPAQLARLTGIKDA